MNIKNSLENFLNEMKLNELKERTIKKYSSDITDFINIIGIDAADQITKEKMIEYKNKLQEKYKTASINNKITIINKFVKYLGSVDLTLKQIKQQKKTSLDNVISQNDYERLLRMAERLGKNTMYHLMETLAGTGIRIDELQYITVEAVKKGFCKVTNKGKIRDIIISKNLVKSLKEFCKTEEIKDGIIFTSKNKKILDKAYIWRELKYIAGQARVKKDKVHAHSFRHLFAKDFIEHSGNITALADLLGHSNLNTTRIYTQTSTEEKRAILDKIAEKKRAAK